MSITVDDFRDDVSKEIFVYRENFYKNRDFNDLLKMLCKEYGYYTKKANRLFDRLIEKIQNTSGPLVIYGAGKNAVKAKKFLDDNEFSKRFRCYATTKQQAGKDIECVSDLLCDKTLLYLIPEGKYAGEMYRCLLGGGQSPDRILIIPRVVLEGNRVELRNDLLDIFMDEKNKFIVYGADWTSYLIRHLLHYSGKDEGFVIAEQERIPNKLNFFKDLDCCYFIVYNQKRHQTLLSQGIPDKRIVHLMNMDELQYFDDEILPKSLKDKQGWFIDGGSADLFTSECFLRWCGGKCDGVLAFECDDRCSGIIKDKISKDKYLQEKCQLLEYGLWSSETELQFTVDSNLGSASVYYPPQPGNEVVSIKTTTIDIHVTDKRISFIKLDIEGAELEALKGATETIKKWKPTLAIAVYHKPEDIVVLPEYIKSIVPGYKFYLRNYHFDMTEAVLYAIYDE